MTSITQYPQKTSNVDTPVFCGRKVVGLVRGSTLHKSVSASKHFLRQPPAIANDITVLDDAQRAGADRVDIFDMDTGRHYTTTIAFIRANGFSISRGFGAQIALPLSWWSVDGKPPSAAPAVNKTVANTQPRLF